MISFAPEDRLAPAQSARSRQFTRFAWSVVGLNIVVILWGAYVRATGSGAGCGNHWPLCNGEIIPRAPALETVIEWSHRLTSGLALLAVVALVVWAYRLFPKRNMVRRAAAWSLLFIIGEALIGAGLVLLDYVATNLSFARVFWIAGHLMNTFLLLAALTLTAWWSRRPGRLVLPKPRIVAILLAISAGMLLILGAGGAVTALGDTLALFAGIGPERSALVGNLVALRIYHPLWALATGLVLLVTLRASNVQQTTPLPGRLAWTIGALYALQLSLGALNVLWKAPIALQLLHLFFADLIWIAFVLYGAVILSAGAHRPHVVASAPERRALEQRTLAAK